METEVGRGAVADGLKRVPPGRVEVLATLRTLGRLARGVACVLHGALQCAVLFPFLDAAGCRQRVCRWSRGMLRAFAIELRPSGPVGRAPVLLLANHVSWLDILALNAVAPVRFVAKSDLRAWPVLGFMVACGGTLFIERDRKRDALRVVHRIAEALGHGDVVAVFPEGTTGTGPVLLPFHANLLQAAVATDAALQAVALRYADQSGAFSACAAYVGEMSLLQSVWRVAGARGMQVHVAFLPPIAPACADRRSLAESARRQIQQHLDAGGGTDWSRALVPDVPGDLPASDSPLSETQGEQPAAASHLPAV